MDNKYVDTFVAGSVQKQDSYNEELETQLSETLAHMLSSMKTWESQTMDVRGKSVSIDDMSYDIRDAKYQCHPGSILANKTCG